MKNFEIGFPVLVAAGSLLMSAHGPAQQVQPATPNPPPNPPPVSVVTPPAAPPKTYVYDQKLMGGRPMLVGLDQANAIIDKFKSGYPKLGSPRVVLFVNRELINQKPGLRLTPGNEKTDAAGNAPKVTGENRGQNGDKPALSLADKQTMRDVERLFGRPLRMAGASLTDQSLAMQLIPGRLPESLAAEGDQAGKDRQALSTIADIAIEVLISSKNVTVPELTGDNTYPMPDIQATAIRLSDARILGQASSGDVTGRFAPAMARNFSVQEIAEATALALMEDMLTGVDLAAKAEQPK